MEYQEQKLKNKFNKPILRRRIGFSFFGFILHNWKPIYTGVLFDYVVLKEQKIRCRKYKNFYLAAWKYKWKLVEIE